MRPHFSVLALALAAACGNSGSPHQSSDAPSGVDDAPAGRDAAGDALVGSDAAVGSDAGAPDVNAEIAAARAAADGSAALPIDGALVTYVAPSVGSDPAGLFIQGQQAGPALFVAVDPASLTPAPAPGETVSFSIADMTTVDSQRRADAISGWTVSGSGADLTGIVQDLSNATDVVSGLDSYDSELVIITGTVTSSFASSAQQHVAAELDTAAITADASLRFRLPTTIQTSADLAQACVVTVGPTPLWRFNTSAEPSAWDANDVHVSSCPAPKVVGAVATDATTVVVTFDRLVDPDSVGSDGHQFTFDNSLTATAAVVSGKTVTVTTSAESNITYNLTVDPTVTDTYGTTLDVTAQTAPFNGFATLATMLLNEVNPNISGSHDLVELLVTGAGTLSGIMLVQDVKSTTILATLPNLNVAAGDLVVVHLNAPVTVTTETATQADCADAACYPAAWDVVGGTTGITFSNRTLRVITPGGVVQDAVVFAKANTTSPAGFPADLQALQASGDWLAPDCGGAPCDYTTTPLASDPTISVDWAGTGSGSGGNTVARTAGANTKTAADWKAGAQSLGKVNP